MDSACIDNANNADPSILGGLISIVSPTFNERENVPILYQLIAKAFSDQTEYDFELIIVDDNSPDGTRDAVIKLQRLYGEQRIKLVCRPCKLGLGSAYFHGVKVSRGDLVVLMDADLSHHPKYILDFLRVQRSTGCDVVTGTRYDFGGGVCGWSWKRKLTSRGANLLASFVLGSRVSDLTGSFRLYRRGVLTRLLGLTRSKGYAFQMEVIIRAQMEGYDVREVPIIFVDRLYGTSKLGLQEYVLFVKGLLSLMFIEAGGKPATEGGKS